MKWGNLTHWDSGRETVDQWLEREHKAKEEVEHPTCPYCHYIHHEWWDFSGLSDYQVEDYEMQCHSCEKKFLCDKETQVRFETKKIEAADE